jgi:hypothetical protein
LSLGDTRVAGSGFKNFAAHQRLAFLYLASARLTEPGLGDLNNAPLGYLYLGRVEFDEPAFRDLARLRVAATINLSDSNVRDEWLPHLAGLGNTTVDLIMERTDVSNEAVAALRKCLPGARIIASPRSSAP